MKRLGNLAVMLMGASLALAIPVAYAIGPIDVPVGPDLPHPLTPVIQQPVIQQPVIQQPVIQQPVIQEPVIQQPSPVNGGGGGPGPNVATHALVPFCAMNNAFNQYQDNNCSSYVIGVDDLNRELTADMQRPDVLAHLMRRIANREVYVELSAQPEEARPAMAALKENLIAAAAAIGDAVRDAKNGGGAGADDLPSLDEIDDLVSQAKDDVEAIDQPLNEDPEARRIRLGIGPHVRKLSDDLVGP